MKHKTRTLFHFTCLFHLSHIVAQGLTRGDLAGTNRRRNVVSLTKNPEPTEALWGGELCGPVDKLKIRITAQVDYGERLMRWRDALDKFGCPRSIQRRLNPCNEGHNWMCYFGAIPPSALSFEARSYSGVYRSLAGDRLAELVNEIEIERKKFDCRNSDGYSFIDLHNGNHDSFLIDGPQRELYLQEHHRRAA